MLLVAALLLSSFYAWEDQHAKLASMPIIIWPDNAEMEKAFSTRGSYYYNINITIKTERGVVHNASPSIVNICVLSNGACSHNPLLHNRDKIIFHRGAEDSYKTENIDAYGEKITPFFIFGKDRLVLAVDPKSDNTCKDCSKLPFGEYNIELIVAGDEISSQKSYKLLWTGEINNFSLSKIPEVSRLKYRACVSGW